MFSLLVDRLSSRISGAVTLFACLPVLLVFAGCGVSPHPTPPPTPGPTPTVTIAASPAAITAGASSSLTISATNATGVTVTGTDGSSYTLQPTGGTQAVTPTATVTYTATATGAGGKATATTTVTVNPAPAAAPTVSITATPSSVVLGTSSVLNVITGNATQVTVTGSDGSSYTLQPTGGTQAVTPTATTTYKATATGAGGTASATVTVTVTAPPVGPPAPTVTINANPTSITADTSSLLTVVATNATQVTVTGSDGKTYTLAANGGTQAVSPPAARTTTTTYTYTATAIGPGGTVTATATVKVTPNPPPTVTISASPSSIVAGNSSTLTVATSYATQVTITGNDGTNYVLPSSSGSYTVKPTATTTYTATATGPGGTTAANVNVTVTPNPPPTVSITANPTSIIAGNSSTLAVTATDATQVTVAGTDGSSKILASTGGSLTVSPTSSTGYTATASGPGGNVTATVTVDVQPPGSIQSVNHVIFMLQENHTFDNYFGMLNPYRQKNGWNVGDDGKTYNVDGIDDKLTTISNDSDEGTAYSLFKFTSSCIDDETSSWLESYGDVNRYDFSTTRQIKMDGFVHTAENYAKNCLAGYTKCAGTINGTPPTGRRAMGYYDENFLNYYYYMASQFAVSDRWFSPISSKSIDNRIAAFTGGTTQGLVFDPGNDDGLKSQLDIPTIFQELDQAKVSWKIYYTVTQGACLDESTCGGGPAAAYPATNFSSLSYSYQYLYIPPSGTSCAAPTQPSSVVGDSTNSFCIDPDHIAPLAQYYKDLQNGTLPSFAFIEAGYGINDEHPGSGQSILAGQAQVAKVVNAFMSSSAWKDSVFFLSYDEGGGPYDHVPPVPNHSNDYTDATVGSVSASQIPDISTIAVNPDSYNPCLPPTPGTPTVHCDLVAPNDPGSTPTDAAANPSNLPSGRGFSAQLGFRLPNMIISPFTRKHYVSHAPMDHTAVLKFVENRFIGPSAHLTARDAVQPDLLNIFDFTNVPWATPPTPPIPVSDPSSCTPANYGP
ncbi:MAG: hypothetical protein HIU93_02780 [Acidobacteria bacterium]|nr:hypothetical protein [Acidobacteriota bacterium]MBW4044561.1 hypothetical protein [Acidobacteriota bacterium]